MYTDPVGSIDQEDVKGLMKKPIKYKLLGDLPNHQIGEIWEVRVQGYISPVVFIQHLKGHKSEAQSWVYGFLNENRENPKWFTPLIESEPRVIEKLSTEIVQIRELASWHFAKDAKSKINELVDAVNALQKGK